ncbi:hypothetical protein AB0D71_26465 [Streptomyces avermitilis]|uniref:hypothetical protein n=1 Tax=Streptomyces avermitilis TaxID=33903 RepID=UPI003409B55A
MNKLKKATAVAVMVGGVTLGGGVAHSDDNNQTIGNFCTVIGPDAGDGDRYGGQADVIIGNLQAVQCNQEFDGGAAFAPVQGLAT